MIKNDQQLAAAQQKLDRLEEDIQAIQDPTDRRPYEAMARDIRQEINEYRAISEGRKSQFSIDEIDDLVDDLVKARIVSGMTQEELAKRLGKQEQQIQRWESGGYESAALWRIAEVIEALEYSFEGVLRPWAASWIDHSQQSAADETPLTRRIQPTVGTEAASEMTESSGGSKTSSDDRGHVMKRAMVGVE